MSRSGPIPRTEAGRGELPSSEIIAWPGRGASRRGGRAGPDTDFGAGRSARRFHDRCGQSVGGAGRGDWDAVVSIRNIASVLNAGGEVSLRTDYAEGWYSGLGDGVIRIQSDIFKDRGGDATLELLAGNEIEIAEGVSIVSSSGRLRILADANHEDGNDSGIFRLGPGSRIRTNHGNVTVRTEGYSIAGRIETAQGDIRLEDKSGNADSLASAIKTGGDDYRGDELLRTTGGDITLTEDTHLTLHNHALRAGGELDITARTIGFSGSPSIPKIIVPSWEQLRLVGATDPSIAG